MSSNIHTMVSGTNEFIEDLKARYADPCEYRAEFLLITFSGDNISVGKWRNVKELDMYTSRSFECHGTTPLWDACEIGLDKIATECADCTAALYVFTDGDDNNSKKATRTSIREKVASLDTTKHTMLFIGSDPLSSKRNANDIGLDRHRSLNHRTDSTESAMRACTNTIARCVTGESQTPEFNDDDIIMSEGHG
jgi:Mg-chelatase subunit ChlD